MAIKKPNSRFSEKPAPKVDTGPGKTEQAHKRETDMNYILRDYYASGMIKHANKYEGRYDDVPAVDFQQAMILVTNAQNMFNDLPSNLRNKFENDPGKFLAWTDNPDNRDEMVKYGILKGNDGLDITGAATNSPTKENAPPKTPTDETPVARGDTP